MGREGTQYCTGMTMYILIHICYTNSKKHFYLKFIPLSMSVYELFVCVVLFEA